MNTNMHPFIDNKFMGSLPPKIAGTIAVLVVATGFVKEFTVLITTISPEIRHVVDKSHDYAMTKLALEHGYHTGEFSEHPEECVVYETSAA